MKISLYFTLALIILIASEPLFSQKNVTIHRDLEYARAGDKSLLLDLHLPDGVANPPLVVWVHGGGWKKGEKTVKRIAWMTEHGYALAGISYRLTGDAIFPAQIHDCKAAIRWLRANAKTYGYDPDRIGVGGSSAGGHLAALLGTTGGVKFVEGTLGDHLKVSSAVKAVCDLWGPSDLLQMGGRHNRPNSPESKLIGGAIQENKDKATLANPITYVDKNDPPFALIHGDQDKVVPLNQSELLHAALKKVGVESNLHVLEGGEHGGRGFSIEKQNKMVLSFFDKHLKKGKK